MVTESSEDDKIYWSIGEVAERFNVNTSLIRFWEKEFSIIRPHKNKKGDRLFTRRDVSNFGLIYHLVKEKGFTLDGARSYMKKKPVTLEAESEILESLRKIKSFLLSLEKAISETAEDQKEAGDQ